MKTVKKVYIKLEYALGEVDNRIKIDKNYLRERLESDLLLKHKFEIKGFRVEESKEDYVTVDDIKKNKKKNKKKKVNETTKKILKNWPVKIVSKPDSRFLNRKSGLWLRIKRAVTGK